MENREIPRGRTPISFRDQKLTVLEILELFRQAEEAGKTEFTFKDIKRTLHLFLMSKAENDKP